MLAAAAAFLALAAGSPPEAALVSCEREAAQFRASMAARGDASRMSLRFTLQAQSPGRRVWRRLSAPGFGEWTWAAAGVSRYSFTRRVEALLGPARYRVRVRFRWHDAAGELVAFANRTSRACRQPDRRPNLLIAAVEGDDGGRRVLVRNNGRGAAGGFLVAVGEKRVRLDGLAAGGEQAVTVPAEACGLAVADAADEVDERSERDNAHAIACS